MASKYEIFPLFLLVHTEKTGCILPLKSANLGLSDSRQVMDMDLIYPDMDLDLTYPVIDLDLVNPHDLNLTRSWIWIWLTRHGTESDSAMDLDQDLAFPVIDLDLTDPVMDLDLTYPMMDLV
jgi:hypothetical protein